ncbi:hypothetical protein IFM89_023099 [Coptis chinensis]|uniref:S1 motif domain-containing protein n=1 Tax=Coptis chinensis TaxID=261450 RepID=A0A835HUQ3_9MAGN|nr:hypothetical protein IFM89_023099 [Coptis chinensis]
MFSASAAVGSVTNLSFLTTNDAYSTNHPLTFTTSSCLLRKTYLQQRLQCNTRVLVSGNIETEGQVDEQLQGVGIGEDAPETTDSSRQSRRYADWKAARAYKESGAIFEGRIESFNGGGLLVRFYSLLGFLPYPLLSPSHSCKGTVYLSYHFKPHKSIQEIGKDLAGSLISVKVVQASEENRKLIFSEKEAVWSKFSGKIKIGDIFSARVGTLEDYGAFVHLRFPDGYYHVTGLVHISEVSWDLVQDVRDVLNEGDEVRVKVIQLDRGKSRVTLSIKQLEDDPLLETLDKVIPEDGQFGTNTSSAPDSLIIEPLPGLESICKELLQENGLRKAFLFLFHHFFIFSYKVTGVRINRQGFEKRVVSQDLQLWLSNEQAVGNQFTLLARAGRQVNSINSFQILVFLACARDSTDNYTRSRRCKEGIAKSLRTRPLTGRVTWGQGEFLCSHIFLLYAAAVVGNLNRVVPSAASCEDDLWLCMS